MNKTDTVEDFFQMIFKIKFNAVRLAIHPLLRITIRDNIRKHSECSSKQESSWGLRISQTKTLDTDVILSPSYPQSESIVLRGPRRRRLGWDLEDETYVRQASNYYV